MESVMTDSERKAAAENLYDTLGAQAVSDYTGWADYRREQTDLLLAACDPGTTLGIFGAGQCADLDLFRLSLHFSGIVLFDIDEEAMKTALRRLRAEELRQGLPASDVSYRVLNLAGFGKEELVSYAEALLRLREGRNTFRGEDETEAAEGNERIRRLLRELCSAALKQEISVGESFDYTAAFGFFSQLTVMAAKITEAVLGAPGAQNEGESGSFGAEDHESGLRPFHDRDAVFRELSFQTGKIVERAAEAMINATDEIFFWGLDAVNAEEKKTEIRWQDFFEGSRQAYLCFASRLERFAPGTEAAPVSITRWPLTKEKTYLVLTFAAYK